MQPQCGNARRGYRRQVRIQHPTAHQFYQYQLGERFDPGAMAEAFVPKFANPILSFRGAGRLCGEICRPFASSPQVWFNPIQPVIGLGGNIAGQFIHQPLLDPTSA